MRDPVAWIRKPELTPSGLTDYLAYVHATELIARHTFDPYDGVSEDIKDVFEYLLLLRHPVTGESRKPDDGISEEDATDKILLLRKAVVGEFERSIGGRLMRPYCVLQLLHEIGRGVRPLWSQGAEPAMLLLSLWLTRKTISRSADPVTCRACMKLIKYGKTIERMPPERELCSGVPGYAQWFALEMDRVFTVYESMDDIVREVVYMGYLATLVRACRMVDKDDRLQLQLGDEEAWMQVVIRTVC
jgi:hypothetical protein